MPLLAFNTGSVGIKLDGYPVTVPPSPSTSSLTFFNVTSYLEGSSVQDFYRLEQQRLSSSLGYVWSGVINFDCRPLTPNYGVPEPLGAILGTPPYVPPPLGEDLAALIEHPVGSFVWTKLNSGMFSDPLAIFSFFPFFSNQMELGQYLIDPQFQIQLNRTPDGYRGFDGFHTGTMNVFSVSSGTRAIDPPFAFGNFIFSGTFVGLGPGYSQEIFALNVGDAISTIQQQQVATAAWLPRLYWGIVQQPTFSFTPEYDVFADDFESGVLGPAWTVTNPPSVPPYVGPQVVADTPFSTYIGAGNWFYNQPPHGGTYHLFIGSLDAPFNPFGDNNLPGYNGSAKVSFDADLTLVDPLKNVQLSFWATGATNDSLQYVQFKCKVLNLDTFVETTLLSRLFDNVQTTLDPYTFFTFDLTSYIGSNVRITFETNDDRVGFDPILNLVDDVKLQVGTFGAAAPLVFDEAFILALSNNQLLSSNSTNFFGSVPNNYRFYWVAPTSYGPPNIYFQGFQFEPVTSKGEVIVTNVYGVPVPLTIWESDNMNWLGGNFGSINVF
jgi:hypothetical protein